MFFFGGGLKTYSSGPFPGFLASGYGGVFLMVNLRSFILQRASVKRESIFFDYTKQIMFSFFLDYFAVVFHHFTSPEDRVRLSVGKWDKVSQFISSFCFGFITNINSGNVLNTQELHLVHHIFVCTLSL
jgi:hypothetical protein